MLSIIVPTLNAEKSLPGTLAALAEAARMALAHEIIVSDGGSRDRTCDIARRSGARVVVGKPGRGIQLAAGAAAARHAWLLFLHADTRPAPGWVHVVRTFMTAASNADRAAYFRFALDDASPAARRVESLAMLRCRLFALPYGDQGLLIARAMYEALGGFNPLPLMEDVDFVRRIGRRRLTCLDHAAVTSADRYRRDGWWCRPLRNLTCLSLYFLGVPPARILRFYG